MNKKPLIVIVGPTAVGKTSVSIALTLELEGEIISADSMQVYKYMNIGTAKPTLKEQSGIPHYLIDEVTPDESFNVVKYKTLADQYIDNTLAKGKTPIMVGGTGLYIDAVIYNIQFSKTVCDLAYREKLHQLANQQGNEHVHQMLEKVDPVAAKTLHPNNIRRVIRALEVYHYTGTPISTHQKESRTQPVAYDVVVIGLSMDRELLYKRINQRVDIMLAEGLVDEVCKLLEMGYTKELTSMKGLGYKEIVAYLEGAYTLEEATEILKRDTRRYAKRQLTWFKRNKDIFWIDITDHNGQKKIMEKIKKHVDGNGII